MRRGGNARRNAFDPGEMWRHRIECGEGKRRQAAEPREREGALGLGGRIQPTDAGDETGAVGNIGIVDAEVDAGLGDLIAILAEALERPRGIDDEMGPHPRQLFGEITVTIEGHGLHQRAEIVASQALGAIFRRPEIGNEIVSLFKRAPRNQQPQPRFIAKQLGEPPAEGAVATDDEQAKSRLAHAMNRLRCSGVGTMQLCRPAIFSRLRAMNS